MNKKPTPGEPPAEGDIQPRDSPSGLAPIEKERRRRKAVDQELAKERPTDGRVDGLTGKYIA